MPPDRKRRVTIQDPNETGVPSDDAPATQSRQQRRRIEVTPGDSDFSNDNNDNPETQGTQEYGAYNAMVKKMVRLALASEYSRLPIRRNDISQKVLGEHGSRQFKFVFNEAQKVLKETFGMQMIEQPMKEKITVSQRRAAQRVEKPSASSKTWTVISMLPQKYRTPEILPPSKIPSSATESTYIALYTFIISIVMLSGGSVEEQKLERYLRRLNADSWTPIDRTDRLLARLCKEGYLVRNREVDSGEELVEYYVGTRGKIEVGNAGASGLIREVYGYGNTAIGGDEAEERRQQQQRGRRDGNNNEGEEEDSQENFEKRLRRSLGIRESNRNGAVDEEEDGSARQSQSQRNNENGDSD